MLITAFINTVWIAVLLMTAPIRILPDANLSATLTGGIHQIYVNLHFINAVFPLDTLAIMIGVYFSIEIGIFTIKSINWAIRKIPGIS